MWASLALAAAVTLTPAQAGPLKLANVRVTNGFLGPTRENNKLLPGDLFYVSFDIEGLKVSDAGKAEYSMGMELTDSAGAIKFKEDPSKREFVPRLGGNRLAMFANSSIGNDTPPGVYTLRVTIADALAGGKPEVLEQKFEVLPKGFGLIRPQLAYPAQGFVPAPPVAVAGQTLMFTCAAVGFQRAKAENVQQPNLGVEVKVYDESGKPTLPQPYTDLIKDVPETYAFAPISVPLPLNRPGKFTVEVLVTDNVAKKGPAKFTFPLTVLEMK
jgi:hypothetical protein